jgi:hypothetical protein
MLENAAHNPGRLHALSGVFLFCKTRWLKKDTVTNMPLIFQNSKQADESWFINK